MRISKTQEDVLLTLLAIESKGIDQPIPATGILKIVNDTRDVEIFGSAFRSSMHTLVRHKLINKHRNMHTARLAFMLSNAGREKASEIKAKLDK